MSKILGGIGEIGNGGRCCVRLAWGWLYLTASTIYQGEGWG